MNPCWVHKNREHTARAIVGNTPRDMCAECFEAWTATRQFQYEQYKAILGRMHRVGYAGG